MSIDNHSHQDHDHFADEDTCWITSSLSVFDGVVKLALESSLEWNTWEDLKVDHPTQKTKQDNLLEVSRPLNQAHLFYMTMHDLRLHKITAYRSLILILGWQKKGTSSPWGVISLMWYLWGGVPLWQKVLSWHVPHLLVGWSLSQEKPPIARLLSCHAPVTSIVIFILIVDKVVIIICIVVIIILPIMMKPTVQETSMPSVTAGSITTWDFFDTNIRNDFLKFSGKKNFFWWKNDLTWLSCLKAKSTASLISFREFT